MSYGPRHGHAFGLCGEAWFTQPYQDLEEKMKRDAATSAKPPKNIGPAAKRRSGIHHDRGKDMSADRAGTSKKNIVTKPLSLSVTVKAT